MHFSVRRCFSVYALFCLGLVGCGLILGEVARLHPCHLCNLQRLYYLLAAFFALCGALWPNQRRLWADVRRTPDLHGRFVVWDLTEGSYDTELARRRAERAANDPPPLTPERWEAILRGLRSGDLAEQLWARHQAQWYDQGDEAFVPTFFDPRVWDATNDDSVA